jgi:hypothetical protein
MSEQDRARHKKMQAASFFMERANAAIEAADRAGSEDAAAAFFKEAETWLYMASHCLNPESTFSRPEPMAPMPKVARERRSFGGDD